MNYGPLGSVSEVVGAEKAEGIGGGNGDEGMWVVGEGRGRRKG